MKQYLFSYGTLQLEQVQRSSFGRLLKGIPDILIGYELKQVRITDPEVLATSDQEFHPIAIYTGKEEHQIKGVIFEITTEELLQADQYEVADYQRKKAIFLSGKQAWVYVQLPM